MCLWQTHQAKKHLMQKAGTLAKCTKENPAKDPDLFLRFGDKSCLMRLIMQLHIINLTVCKSSKFNYTFSSSKPGWKIIYDPSIGGPGYWRTL
jgi:hypothetical protein